jgi:hypothetical protein
VTANQQLETDERANQLAENELFQPFLTRFNNVFLRGLAITFPQNQKQII